MVESMVRRSNIRVAVKTGLYVIVFTGAFLAYFILMAFQGDTKEEQYKKREEYLIRVLSEYRSENEKLLQGAIEYVNFREALAWQESRCNHEVVNKIGAAGKYQFMKRARGVLEVEVDLVEFEKSPWLWPEHKQDMDFNRWVLMLEHRLKKEILEYDKKYIGDSVLITKSGILASAHLAGVGGVKRYLNSNGRRNPDDGSMSIEDYMKMFSSYNF